MGLSRRMFTKEFKTGRSAGGWSKEFSIGEVARALEVNANVAAPLAA